MRFATERKKKETGISTCPFPLECPSKNLSRRLLGGEYIG